MFDKFVNTKFKLIFQIVLPSLYKLFNHENIEIFHYMTNYLLVVLTLANPVPLFKSIVILYINIIY